MNVVIFMIDFLMELLTDCFTKLPGERFKGRSPVALRVIVLFVAFIALVLFCALIWWVSLKFSEMGSDTFAMLTKISDIIFIIFAIIYSAFSIRRKKRNRKYLRSTVSLR